MTQLNPPLPITYHLNYRLLELFNKYVTYCYGTLFFSNVDFVETNILVIFHKFKLKEEKKFKKNIYKPPNHRKKKIIQNINNRRVKKKVQHIILNYSCNVIN